MLQGRNKENKKELENYCPELLFLFMHLIQIDVPCLVFFIWKVSKMNEMAAPESSSTKHLNQAPNQVRSHMLVNNYEYKT